ncbi:NgoFVII family restriction endonuclease [Bacillus sp. NTK074B]|uniref:restriction endonuclease PLD domain-containing protein n=1 Tax=Bacillus sp. NTK074B TaxID=2802174 RepID=UPI001A8D5420|nr:NgoFVII family restriction endonuclease [Bacillus sp. NTK074B]
MYLTTNLINEIFEKPYVERLSRKLNILTGYASSSFLHHILERYPEIEINLIIGMAKKDGINLWDHQEYQILTKERENVNVFYYNAYPSIHSKVYHWLSEDSLFNEGSDTFVGSANFSWNGFRDQIELLVPAHYDSIIDVFKIDHLLKCTDSLVESEIKLHSIFLPNRDHLSQNEFVKESVIVGKDFIDLPLFIEKEKKIHQKSGLNWGQRTGREPNQAYIPVPTSFNKRHPRFFPPLKEEFTMLTDDRQSFICVMAQENRKAIESSRNNSLIGKYFRERLGLYLGAKVELGDLEKYGRKYVRVHKLDNETFYMDFSKKMPSYS